MNEDERRKKIEAGKAKLAKFKNKRRKKEITSDVKKNVTNIESSISTEITNIKVSHESSESLETSSIESLCTKRETPNNIKMEPDLIVESSHQFSEGSDDTTHLENDDLELVSSLYNQKIESYCTTIRKHESIIKQLTERLASAMSANEAADSAGSQEVMNLKQEINVLHQQMREATEMLERQKSESREIQNASGDGNHFPPGYREAILHEAGVQVETAELLQLSQEAKPIESLDKVLSKYSDLPEFSIRISNFLQQSISEVELKKIIKSLGSTEFSVNNSVLESLESLDEVLLKYSKFPKFSLKLSAFLKQSTTEEELRRILKILNPTEKNEIFDSLESLDEVLLKYSKFPKFSQKLGAFLKNNTTEVELKNILKDSHLLGSTELAENKSPVPFQPISETSSLLKRIETLSVITKLIESLANASTRTLSESADFSCSKFQSFFLRRLNSNDGEPEVSEAEGDINYAEVAERSPVQNELPSIERLRSSIVAKDFDLVTDFLLDEMEKMSSTVSCTVVGPRGDVMVDSLETELPDVSSIVDGKDGVESDYQRFLLQKSKLESRVNNLKKMDPKLQNPEKNVRHISIDSDTLTNFEDNILFEEPPLSCVSLLSLTDSEYKTESVMTDSELNSRKVSFDMMRPAQDRDFCAKCDRYYELVREKYDDHMCIFKDSLENSLNIEKAEAAKNLGIEIEKLKAAKDQLSMESSQQIELLCQEQELKTQHLRKECNKYLQESESKWVHEKENFILNLRQSNERIQTILKEKDNLAEELETLKSENTKNMSLEQNQIEAHLKKIEEFRNELAESNRVIEDISKKKELLAQELEAFKLNSDKQLAEETCKIESQYISTFEMLKKLHEEEIGDMKSSFVKQLEKQELSLRNEHSQAVSLLESSHSNESATLQKKIEQLLEEKCELLAKTSQEYEAILKKNHKALLLLCNHLRTQLSVQKERIFNESQKSANSLLEMSFTDVLDELNRSIEHGIIKFLNQNYFLASDNEENFDDTEYLPLEIRLPISDNDVPSRKENVQLHNVLQKCNVPEPEREMSQSLTQLSEGSIESDDFYLIRSEMNKLQEEFQKDAQLYQEINNELKKECESLRKQTEVLEEHKRKLEAQLQEKENELATKESELATIDASSKNSMSGSQLSSTEIRSWQVDAAQTNSRLLHVLSDLVKTFLDIEHDINSHLVEHGLTPSRSGTFTHHDEETGHSVGSREDFASLGMGECPNIELVEDGLDLTPRTWDLFAAVGSYDTEIEGEDVVLGASRRLRHAVDHVLNLLTRALNNQQNQDLKLLLKRNEELSQELQEESLGRDAVHMELLTAESTIRKLEGEKQRLEDSNRDLKENEELLKREMRTERNRTAQLAHEKEVACDEIQMLKGQCELLASRLGDPEKTGIPKMSDSSDTCVREQAELLQENSKLSTEKQSVQKNLSRERQSFLDRLHQMELALEELTAEKDAVVEQKCKEIQELRAEMEAMEKQFNSNKKFIDEQAQEREQEREEYIREVNKMREVVREKEKIQSNEAQLAKEIESLEQLLRARIEDHQSAMKKKEAVENELRQSVDKIRDLRDVIEELETQLDMKCKIETGLRQNLSGLTESISAHEKIHIAMGEASNKPKNVQMNGESIEQVENLKEQLASQSQEIEQMSQNQTLLHELRGQIHFLEAKVEQRARTLEGMLLATSPVQSDDNSPGGSQGGSETPLQMPCEDGYEMSPRSIHWLEIRRLEEKIGRLAHVDEELLRRNKELEGQMKKMRLQQNEFQHENAALHERLSEQLVQVSVLKSHIEEEKHRCNTPRKSQAANNKIEQLHEALEQQLENNKRLVSEMQEMQGDLYVFKEEIQLKDNVIAMLQKNLDAFEKTKHINTELDEQHASAAPYDSNQPPACFKLMLLEKNDEVISKIQEIEFLQKELEELRKFQKDSSNHSEGLEESVKITEEVKKENAYLKLEVERLNSELDHLNECLANAKEQMEMEQAQVETLCEEMANLSQNSIEDSLSHNTDSSTRALEQENINLIRRLAVRDSQLREKALEISMLSASTTKLEISLRASEKEVKLEQVQVETLLQELGSLAGYQKRLEQDFNTVQEMMQQKERELATLHEETDAQMRLEAELEALVKELDEQKAIEEELNQVMKQMEMNFEGSKKDLELQIEQWRSKFEDSEKSHSAEVGDLRSRIKILCRKLPSWDKEDIDVAEVQRQIMEASNSFGADDTETYGSLVYALLKKAVDGKLNQMAKRHEEYVNEINETWEKKIRDELNNKYKFKKHCEKLEKENLLLREKFNEHNQRLSSEKDAHWQAKLSDIENSAKLELKVKYENEIANLKLSLDSASRERSATEANVSTLSRQIKDLKKKYQNQKNEMAKEFESKIASIEREVKERQEAEMSQRQEIERLREDLQSQLQKEENLEERHREEISNLHKFFETRWVTEMKKIQVIQIEELKKLKDSKEKTIEALCNHLFAQYGDKLKGVQDEYAQKLAEEQSQTILKHKSELSELQQSLEKRFEKEKQQIMEMKDKEAKRILESLEKYSKKLSELKRTASSSEQKSSLDRGRWEEERQQLVDAHKREITNQRRELEVRYEEMLQTHLRAHEAQKKSLEEAYVQQVEKVNELMKESRRLTSVTCHSDSGSNRTATPSSEVTSSDEACSSCQEDMLPGNKHLLVRKIQQDGKRVLSLIESCQVPTSTEREARLWLEERKWIIYKIKSLTPEIVENQANLKLVISNLVEELLNARQRLILSNDEVNNTKERCSELEVQLNSERSKLFILTNNLSHQTQMVKEFESQLDSRSNEVMHLKKILANENRLSYLNSMDKASSRIPSENLSSSYDVGCLRSADEPRSAERFSMFLPEIGSSSSYKITEEVEVPQDITPLPQFLKDTDFTDGPTSPDNVFYESKNDVSSLREELVERLSDARNNSSYHAKLHGLYWVYKRSLSYNKSLVYQKNYLLTLLKGFQVTEKVTLAWLSNMNDRSPRSQGNDDGSFAESHPRGRSLFRSAGFVIIAIVRMRYIVRRWRLVARIPSASTVEAEVRGVFRTHLSPATTPGDCHLSSLSLSSKSTSIGAGEPMSNSQTLINSRSDCKSSGKFVNADSSLVDCVHRLKILQKQLGLDQNFR